MLFPFALFAESRPTREDLKKYIVEWELDLIVNQKSAPFILYVGNYKVQILKEDKDYSYAQIRGDGLLISKYAIWSRVSVLDKTWRIPKTMGVKNNDEISVFAHETKDCAAKEIIITYIVPVKRGVSKHK